MTEQVVLYPDAVKVVIAWLSPSLVNRGDTAAVVKDVPHPRPTKFVRVLRTGGPRMNVVVDRPQITIESWDVNAEEAMRRAQLVRGLIHAMRSRTIGGVTCYRIEEAAGPVDLPDPDSAQPRVTFTVTIGMRGTPE